MRDRLARAGDGRVRVLHRSPHAIYLDVEGACVGLVAAGAVQVPCALRTPDLAGVSGERASMRSGVLHLDGVPVVVGRLVETAVPSLASAPRVERSAESRAESRADLRSWVAQLVGAGDGLTPYGDDVLCGWLAIHRAAGAATPEVDAAVRSSLHRTTLLSATLLECALQGEVLPQFADWVRQVGTPGEPATVAALEAVGHSSGRGLLAGGRQGLVDLGVRTLSTGVAA